MLARSGFAALIAYSFLAGAFASAAKDIDDLVSRAEATPRESEKLQPPRCERDDSGEIIHLNLDFVALRPGDIELAAKCAKLESLSLMGTNVTDEQLKLLVDLKHLKGMRLDHTGVGDKGLVTLGKIKTLRSLCLGGVEATPEGVKQLKRDLPKLQVGYARKQPSKN